MKIRFISTLFFSVTVLFLSGCGDKTDLSTFPITNNGNINISDTIYIQQYPIWSGFNKPEAVFAGNDQLIYVADTKNNSIVQMDVAGGR